jgi:glyoxylase-like metal-dependent hydrolase (beta-lactamase superfamily II)
MHHAPDATTRLTRRILAPNPGPMTLDGTNSYLVSAPGASGAVVVDPGPDDIEHLERLRAAASGPVVLILLTHHHPDHTAGVASFAASTGAAVRAIDPALCRDAGPLRDGELIEAAGTSIRVIATPGHTADSACFLLPDDRDDDADADGSTGGTAGSILTGDTILGRGTSIIADPDGALGPYLDSLTTLAALGSARVLPGHGPALPDLVAICEAYRDHRAARLDEVRSALVALGAHASVEAITDLVYAGTDAAVRPAAEASLRAQLAYLRG